MPIDFSCGQCQHTLRVPEESAGMKARCPQCGHVQPIPTARIEPYGKPPLPMGPPPGSQQPPYESYPAQGAPQRPNPYQAPSQYGLPPGYNAPRPKSLEEVRSRVKPPAIAMLVVSILAMLLCVLMMIIGAIVVADEGGDEGDVVTFIGLGFMLVMQLVVAVGSIRMMALKNYGLAMAAAILSLITGLCCQLALPFGIWALVILVDTDTKTHFK